MPFIPCCCGIGCPGYSDTFTGSDGDTFSANFTEVAGDIDRVSNTARCTTSDSLAICTQTHTSPLVRVTVDISFSNDTDTARLVFDYVDSSNYSYLEMNKRANAVKIVQVVAGTPTTLKNRNFAALFFWTDQIANTMRVCVTDDYVIASVSNSSNQARLAIANPGLTSGQAGIATGTLTGTVTFDNFVLDQADGSCECASPCPNCSLADFPWQRTVTFALIGAGTCGSCSSLNTSFVVDFDYAYQLSLGWVCVYTLSYSICNFNRLALSITDSSAQDNIVWSGAGTEIAQYTQPLADKDDGCLPAGTFVHGGHVGTACGYSTGTATVSA